MRLEEKTGAVAVEPPKGMFRSDNLNEIRSLYGGEINIFPNLLGGKRLKQLTSPDGVVTASPKRENRLPGILVFIRDLDLPQNAARWTALQAYRARQGGKFEYLHTEVPGIRGYQEWSNRRMKAQEEEWRIFSASEDELIANSSNLSEAALNRRLKNLYDERDRQSRERLGQPLPFLATTSAGSGNEPIFRYLDQAKNSMREIITATLDAVSASARGDDVGFEMAARSYDSASQAASSLAMPPELPDTHTTFYARGDTLPAAARVMADNYGDLLFHADDPEVAVSRALGVSSLDQLDDLWDGAMRQPTPLAAGRLVLNTLIH